uniref:MICOS complex subunit MIC27-like isoform X1 n=2 Tax=Myxine glutinosa TaxID=7769 RepID=UPI00358E4819
MNFDSVRRKKKKKRRRRTVSLNLQLHRQGRSLRPNCSTTSIMKILHAADHCAGLDRILLEQLPIYTKPYQQSRKAQPPTPGMLEQGIGAVRVTLAPYCVWLLKAFSLASTSVEHSLDFVQEAYTVLSSPPPTLYPRLGLIAGAGLTGAVLASRGARWKRITYPVFLATAAASLCYPKKAVTLSQGAGEAVQRGVKNVDNFWKGNRARPTNEQDVGVGENAVSQKFASDSSPEKGSGAKRAGSLDHGQANPNDADLYTTRR